MINKKFLEKEILSDEVLDYVVGGTRAETLELFIALNKRLYEGLDFNISNIDKADEMLFAKSYLEKELSTFGVTSKIDVGKNGTGEGEQANEYYNRYGKKIPHEAMVKIFNGKKV